MPVNAWVVCLIFLFLALAKLSLYVVLWWKKPDFKEGRWITLLFMQLIIAGGIYSYCMLRLASLSEVTP